MKLLVIGASHGIGLEIVRQGLSAGHDISAMARSPEGMSLGSETPRIIEGDILDKNTVEEAVKGQDAVCIAIGSKPTLKQVSVFSKGTANVIRAMRRHSCKVLLCITGIGAGDSRGHGGFLYDKVMNPLLLGKMYADKDRQEEIVRKSGLEWTIVRPGFLTNGPRTGQYQVLSDLTGVRAKKISRADVADFILREAVQREHKGGTVLLTYWN
jgi:putative NADH-flavin reductase